MNDEANVFVDAPAFSGTATVNYTLPSASDHILFVPMVVAN
jgi:hypothetical protein